jgi:molybdenum cofactor cytidylyltransferase
MRVAILLAAGASRRFGASNKLFARCDGQSLLVRALRIAKAAPVQRLIVVTGAQGGRVAAEVRREARGAVVVRAQDHEEGLGASLRAASRQLRITDQAAFIFLADMPWLPIEQAHILVRRARRGEIFVRPACRGRPGHPVLVRGAALAMLRTARGDEGIGRASGLRVKLMAADRRCIADVDRASALGRSVARLR